MSPMMFMRCIVLAATAGGAVLACCDCCSGDGCCAGGSCCTGADCCPAAVCCEAGCDEGCEKCCGSTDCCQTQTAPASCCTK